MPDYAWLFALPSILDTARKTAGPMMLKQDVQAMAAFLIGTVRITDPDRFADYAAGIKGLSAEFGGEPVVAGPVTDVLEGASPIGERVVVTRFPTVEQAQAYVGSARYLAAKALREGAAEVELRLVVA